jgi:hypothetical protein
MLPVPLSNGRRALVIRVPKSWNPPHAVIQNKSRLIFARNSAGVHEASVDEMRVMFTAGTTLLDRAREFHRCRLTDIHGGDTPFLLAGDQGRMVLHIIPFSAFGTEMVLDPRRVHGQPLMPIWCSGMNDGYNVDGYLTTGSGGGRTGYVQVFRNGIIESAAGDVRARVDRGWILYAEEIEDHICTKIENYMSALAHAEIPPPMLVILGGVRMHGTIMIGKPLVYRETQILQKAELLLPAVTIDDYGLLEEYRRALKPIFDAIWNAAGYGASESYGSDGSWIRRS